MTEEATTISGPELPNADQRRRLADARRIRRLKIMFPFLLVLVFLVYAFTTNFIPSGSMQPNLQPGDHTITMRSWLAYPMGRMPARGDIIVFNLPDAQLKSDPNGGPTADADEGRRQIGVFRKPPGEVLIKRVVGLPGETISIRRGKVYIDGHEYQPNYKILPADPVDDDEYRYGVAAPVKLGPDELFVLGDNGDNSDDGRYWGPLKRKDVLGRFVCVLFNEGSRGPNEKLARDAARRARSPQTPPGNQ